MSDVFEDNPKNIYVIKHKLGELKKHPTDSCFYYFVGNFVVKIFTHKIQEANDDYYTQWAKWIVDPDGKMGIDKSLDDYVTKHEKVDVNLYENLRGTETYINLDTDSRFGSYLPIQHTVWRTSTGVDMPILNLCELIRYLHRLSKISVFY